MRLLLILSVVASGAFGQVNYCKNGQTCNFGPTPTSGVATTCGKYGCQAARKTIDIPACTSANKGVLLFDVTTSQEKLCTGSAWVVITGATVADAGLTSVTSTSALVRADTAGQAVTLSSPLWETTANTMYYLSMTGSDANDGGTLLCQASSGACRTFAFLSSQIPQNIHHTVTINIDAGTYSEPLTFVGHNFSPASQSATPFVQINGAPQTAVTPTTGTASGTLTAVSVSGSIGAPTDYSLYTDNTQTWTTDDFIGKWIDIAGTKYVIAGNTATTIKVAAYPNPTPSVGNAYTITSPATIFSSGSSTAIFMTGNTASQVASTRAVQIIDTTFNSTTGYSISNTGNSLPVSLLRCRLNASSNGLMLPNATSPMTPASAYGFVTSSIGQGSGTTAQAYNASFSSSVMERNLILYNGFFSGAINSNTGNTALTLQGNLGQGASLSPTTGSIFVRCRGGSQEGLIFTGMGAVNTTGGVTNTQNTPYAFSVSNLVVENCTRPLVLAGAGIVSISGRVSLSGEYTNSAASVAATLQSGAILKSVNVPLVSDAGTELSIDSDSWTFEQIRSLTEKSISKHTGTAFFMEAASAPSQYGSYRIGKGLLPAQLPNSVWPDAGGPNVGILIEDVDGGLWKSNGTNYDKIPGCREMDITGYAASPSTFGGSANVVVVNDGGCGRAIYVDAGAPTQGVFTATCPGTTDCTAGMLGTFVASTYLQTKQPYVTCGATANGVGTDNVNVSLNYMDGGAIGTCSFSCTKFTSTRPQEPTSCSGGAWQTFPFGKELFMRVTLDTNCVTQPANLTCSSSYTTY